MIFDLSKFCQQLTSSVCPKKFEFSRNKGQNQWKNSLTVRELLHHTYVLIAYTYFCCNFENILLLLFILL